MTLIQELRNLACSSDKHKFLLGHYQVLHHALECVHVPTKTVRLQQQGLVDEPSEANVDPRATPGSYELVDTNQHEEHQSTHPQQTCSSILWRIKGGEQSAHHSSVPLEAHDMTSLFSVSPAAIISELFACFRAGQLSPDVLCNAEQRYNAGEQQGHPHCEKETSTNDLLA